MKADEILLRGQARAVEEAAEAWEQTQAELDSLAHFEKLIGLLASAAPFFASALASYWDTLFAGKIERVSETGSLLRAVASTSARAYGQLLQALRHFQGRGYEVANAGAFSQAAETMNRLAADVKARWPCFDAAELQAALDSREQPIPVEDILRELQGPHTAEGGTDH